jgi:two-component system response regulator YesN
VIPVPDGQSDEYADRLAERISHNNGMLWPSKITVGIGGTVKGLIQAGDSVKQAEGLLQYAAFWGESGVVRQERVERERSSFMNAASEFLHRGGQQFKAVIYGVNALEEEQALASASRLFDDMEAHKGADGDFIRQYISGLLFELSVLAGTHQDNGGGAAEPGEQLSALHTIASVRAYTLQFIETSIAALREKRGGKDEYVVRQVNKLIEQKYMSPDISLKSIADEVFLSPNYLGSLYKKSAGKAFHDQLSQVRMNKAKELLASPNYKVARVAQEVGIPNTSYFCTVFKNMFGISPGEYQETIHRK